ncbi:MAG: hypothetical protein SF182_03135 [Deltaproteobacteria bacterium]|nr:hypothetical protein [Deltaproteobacteria bacterium]
MIGRLLRAGLALVPLLDGVAQAGAPSSDLPAAIVVYPVVRVGADTDTRIQLSNAGSEVIDADCFYQLTEPTCLGGLPGQSCAVEPNTCSGDCVARQRRIPFHVRITGRQPLAWSARRGLTTPPIDGAERVATAGQSNAGTRVPGLGDGPVDASLRCVVVDGVRGAPQPTNALVGQATLAQATAAARDATLYRAIGIPALPETGNGDDAIVLGGPNAEYAACPTVQLLEHYFSGSGLPSGTSSATVDTELVLTACSSDPDAGAGSVVQFLVYNEFGQRFSTSRPFQDRVATSMATMDTSDPKRSIFSVNVNGTLAGQTQINGYGAGTLALGLETHRDATSGAVHTAALEVHHVGARVSEDRLVLEPACPGDCNRGGDVSIDELITSVNIAIGSTAVDGCSVVDRNADGLVAINELIAAVSASLDGCPAPFVLPSAVPSPSPTPVPTELPVSIGPQITFLGLATADDLPLRPDAIDEHGRAVFIRPHGQGFTLVVEARQGVERGRIGATTYRPDGQPDLQILVSRPLGDGGAAVCENDGIRGGVPAMPDLSFSSDPAVVAAMNDLGCRAYDRQALPRPCTRAPLSDDTPFDFVRNRSPILSEVQYCLPIARAWSFPAGDTIVAVRVLDVRGTPGTIEEMVVRVIPPFEEGG